MDNFLNMYSTEVIGGLIVSVLLLVFNYFSEFIKNFQVKRKYSGYIGDYYLYWYSTTGQNKIISAELSIKSKFGKLNIIANEGNIYKYKGTISINERNIYITLFGIEQLIEFHVVFYSPLHKVIQKLVGTASTISGIDEPVALLCILSAEKLNESQVKKDFKKLDNTNTNFLLKIKKDNSLLFDNISKENYKKIYNKTNRGK